MPTFTARARMLRDLFAPLYNAGPLAAGEPIIPSLPASFDDQGTPATSETRWFDLGPAAETPLAASVPGPAVPGKADA